MSDEYQIAMEAIHEGDVTREVLHEAKRLLRRAELALKKFNQICPEEQLRSRYETFTSASLQTEIEAFLRFPFPIEPEQAQA